MSSNKQSPEKRDVEPPKSTSTPAPATSTPAPAPAKTPTGTPLPPPVVAANNAGNTNQTSPMGNNIVLDLIDAMQHPPVRITGEYVSLLTRVYDWLGKPHNPGPTLFIQTGAQTTWSESTFPEQRAGGRTAATNPVSTGNSLDPQEKVRNAANMMRNGIFDVINKVNAFVARAKNAGFAPPENPFSLAMSYNVGRSAFNSVVLQSGISSKISSSVQIYLKLLAADAAGKIRLDQKSFKAAQLSSANFSLDGFGGTGDASIDLAKLLPDADAIKAQKAAEALSVFDFTKRIPKVLFTAFYAPAGVPKGIILGWKKVADASGYIIKRRNIFDGRDTQYVVKNDEAVAGTNRLREYVSAWILSFYDHVQESMVFSFLDADAPPHGYFFYTIGAYQMQNDNPGGIFTVATSPKILSQPMKADIRSQLQRLEPQSFGVTNSVINRTGVDTISPYPVLAHVLLGDSKYDWLLAAVNIRQSINRGDSRSVTRSYSYLTAQLDFLLAQADVNKLVVPKSIGEVLSNVENAIAKFGVNQVLQELLQETGALYHFDGKEPNDNMVFRTVDTATASNSNLVSTVIAAVDPETAMMDLKILSSNLSALLSGENGVASYDILKRGLLGMRHAKKPVNPTEIAIPSEYDNPDFIRSEDEIQYLQQLDNLSGDVVDLTTVDGLAKFIRVIRIFSDIGPGKGAPIVGMPVAVVPDPIAATPEDEFVKSSAQPIAPPKPKPVLPSARPQPGLTTSEKTDMQNAKKQMIAENKVEEKPVPPFDPNDLSLIN